MIMVLFNKDIFKILSFFSLSPGSRFKRNEIKDKVMINNVPLDKALIFLLNSGMLKVQRNFYSINFENEYSKNILDITIKQRRYLKEIPFKVYLIIIDIVNKISSHKGIEMYLFGSYSKLIYKENSDLDIALLNGKISNDFITTLEKKYDMVIEIHYFEKIKFYNNKNDPLIKDIIKNGVKVI